MSEHYGKAYAQRVPDVVWIRELSAQGYALMTADHRTLVRPQERDGILAAGAIMFALPTGDLTGDQQADRFLRHASRIHSEAAAPGPAGFVVYDRVISRVLP